MALGRTAAILRGGAAVPREPRILTTLDWHRRPRWVARTCLVRRDELGTARALARLVAWAERHDALVLDGASGGSIRAVDLGAAAVLARRRSGPAVVITDATWSRGAGMLDRMICRAGLAAIESPRVTYCVLSSEEKRRFPRTWGVDPARVAFTPYYYTASDEDLAAPVAHDGGVFAGGDSMRDYRPLVEASRGLPAAVTIAARRLPPGLRRILPPNVRAGGVPHEQYMRLLRSASVVVVALAETEDRSAGQQSYLNAMAYGKLVVVPDVMGVRDYLDDRVTGIVVPPRDPRALSEALRWALAPSSRAAVREIGERARVKVRVSFRPEDYVDAVLAATDRAVERARAASAPWPAPR